MRSTIVDHWLKLNIWMVVVVVAPRGVKGRNYDRVGNSQVALEERQGMDIG